MRVVTWHQLPATCSRFRRFAYPAMTSGFELPQQGRKLPRLESVPTAECTVVELGFPGNTKPLVTTLDSFGEAVTVQVPGFQSPYAWDTSFDGNVGRNQQEPPFYFKAMRGHDVVESVRILHVPHGVASPNGNLCAGELCFTDPASFMEGDNLGMGLDPRETGSCSLVQTLNGHLMVLQQKYADQFGHMSIQTMPQAVMLLETARAELPQGTELSLSLIPTGTTVQSLLKEVLGEDVRLILSSRGKYLTAPSTSIAINPPGLMVHEVTWGRGSLRAAFATLHRYPAAALDLLIFMYRPPKFGHWGRRVGNRETIIKRIRKWMLPGYEVREINPGAMPLAEARQMLARARVVMGGHGAAWANLLFAPMHRHDLHAIEFSFLHSTNMYSRLPYYADGDAHYWVVERILTDRTRPAVFGANLQSTSPNHDYLVDEDVVHTVLWHAGVVNCTRRGRGNSTFRITKVPGTGNTEDAITFTKGWLRCSS